MNEFHKKLLDEHWFVMWDSVGSDRPRLGSIIDGVDVQVYRDDMEKLADKYGVQLVTLFGG